MNPVDRRSFLKTASVALGAGLATRLTPSTWAKPLGANDDVRVAVIGINSKGSEHIKQLLDLPGVRIVALCDVDPLVLWREVAGLKEQQINVFAATDAREIFDRNDVDAVVIATSNHWHALLTVWACQAGKDVYVEKPVSHTVWEGRKMVEAADTYKRIVQAGTQYRSDVAIPEAIAYLNEGHVGKMLAAHTTIYKRRESIGKKLPWYPDWLDYDMFCGPTPAVPLERDRLHYDWHWMWRTGNGELGNNGVHVLDIARRFAGHDGLPKRVMSLGGRYLVDDVAETPNTQLAVYDYAEGIPLIYESRGLPANPDTEDMDHNRGVRINGVTILCEGGYFAGYGGGVVYDNNGKVVTKFAGDGGGTHMENFFDAVRSRRAEDLKAPIAVGHGSSELCHYGNISYRIGKQTSLSSAQTSLEGLPAALTVLEGMQKHLGLHGVDLKTHPFAEGPWVHIDAEDESITSVENGDEHTLEFANYLLKENHRASFAIPERV